MEVGRASWNEALARWPMNAAEIRRVAKADLAETARMMQETERERGMEYASRVAVEWADWYPSFIQEEVERIVKVGADADEARRLGQRELKRTTRLIEAACDALHVILKSKDQTADISRVRAVLGTSWTRTLAAITALRFVGAVRLKGRRVTARAEVEHARAWLLDWRARLTERGPDASEPWTSWGERPDVCWKPRKAGAE